MPKHFAATLCCAGVLLIVDNSPVLAQESNPEARNGTTTEIETITVTARRRQEDLQTVPIAINALTGTALDEHGVQNGQDLSHLIPALSTNQISRDEEGYAIRGFSNNGASSQGLENTVTPYFNQVPFPTLDGSGPGRYFDLDNIQVLKGPQGTLFGRNSIGGAILLEPSRPTNDYDAYVSTQYGSHNDQIYEGMLNVPILPNQLMIRVAAKREERDGFTTNIVNGQKLDNRDYWSERIGVEWRPNQAIENYALFDSYYSDTAGSSEALLGANPGFVLSRLSSSFQPTSGACFLGVTLGGNDGAVPGCTASFSISVYPNPELQNAVKLQQQLGSRQVASDVNGLDKTWSSGFTDITSVSVAPDLMLKNILGYREFRKLQRLEEDGSSLPILQQITQNGWSEDLAQYTDEINLHMTTLNGKLDLTAGNFFEFSHPVGDQVEVSDVIGLPPPNLPQPLTKIGSLITQTIHADERSEAVYGEAIYDLNGISYSLRDFKLVAGYRYTWDHRTLNERAPRTGNPAGAPCAITSSPPNPASSCQFDVNATFQSPSWDLGLDWQVDRDTLLYVAGRRGYRSGGLNNTVADISQVLFKPEVVKDVELGLKLDWRYGAVKGRTNLALFHDDVQNAQVSQAFVDAQGDFIALVNNSATATINGIEADTTIVPFPSLQLTGSWAYTKAAYDSFIKLTDGGIGASRSLGSAAPFPYTPLNRFSIDARYFLPVPDSWGDLSVVGTEYYSSHWTDVTSDQFAFFRAYHQLDLHLDWDNFFGKPVTASLFATNVYNSVYKIGGFTDYNTLGFGTGIYNEPRMIGLKLKYHW